MKAKDFITRLRVKLLELQVKMSVLRQEYTAKFGNLESKFEMLFQTTEQYEESSQNHNFSTPHSTLLCITSDDENRQPYLWW